MRVEELIYELPESAIAQSAVEPRDTARLLDARDMTDHHFTDLAVMLEPGDLVVVNETRVRKARLEGHKAGSRGRVELLVLNGRADGHWDVMVRPARRLRVGSKIEFEHMRCVIISGPDDGIAVVEFDSEDVEMAIESEGAIPLPPYFNGTLQDPDRYQTMFSKSPGSAAAPTAGLHFTERVVEALQARSIDITTVDLHVGVDTFRPISVEDLSDHRMHREWCSVPETTAERIDRTRTDGGRVVAIGTTTVRTLESFAISNGRVRPGSMETELFLSPGSEFRVVDVLVTNFHVPGSTLIAMVAAFMGTGWRDAYEEALDRGYRFLSFGDAMLCGRSST